MDTLKPVPNLIWEKPEGYEHFTDPTIMPFNRLTFPSTNCTIPSRDKVVPDKGKLLIGQESTQNQQIIGNKEKFTTMGGISLEVRVWNSDVSAERDVIEVLYTDTNPAGAFYNIPHWYRITENLNPLLKGLHRYSFDQWFDTNLEPDLSLNLPRLVWVNGLPQVFSWTGGIAPIVSMVANTSISTTTGITWASLGFVSPALGGSGNIVVNGVAYAITGGWDTNTLTLINTTGISVNNIATAQIEVNNVTPKFDFCKQSKNHMFYGQWTSRKLSMSNAFNRPATPAVDAITSVQAFQNDLVVSNSPYTGTVQNVYRVTIDSVNPDINIQSFQGFGVNDGVWDTSGYITLNPNPGVENLYRINIVADIIIGAATNPFVVGEGLTGASGAIGVLVGSISYSGAFLLAVKSLNFIPFEDGEVITGSSGATLTIGTAVFNDWFQYTKNGVVVNVNTGFLAQPMNPVFTSGPITLSDGLEFSFGNIISHVVGDNFELDIRTGGNDTFQWQRNGGIPVATFVPITGAIQPLELGLEISFVNKTGHQLGDYWEITENPRIAGAWYNFYYTLPSRRPGEGFIFTLPSNFWTMDTQEDKLYVNTQYGEWSTITSELSADLLSEKVNLNPLKQSGSLKTIDPWMTGHLEDDLIFVTEDKSLMSIGRKEFLQEPQDGYISDLVKLDFLPCSFINGGIKYIGKRLYVTSPEDAIMHCYDVAKRYWQSPKTFPEMGIPTIIGNKLCVHSNIKNRTFEMFGSDTDHGQAYTVIMRTPPTAGAEALGKSKVNARWESKLSGASFIEGYIEGAPSLIHTTYTGINGCQGEDSHPVQPIICKKTGTAPFGEGANGSHPFGSDPVFEGTYFNEIFSAYKPILSYYFLSLGIQCLSKNHTYSILSMSMNCVDAPTANNTLWNTQFKEDESML